MAPQVEVDGKVCLRLVRGSCEDGLRVVIIDMRQGNGMDKGLARTKGKYSLSTKDVTDSVPHDNMPYYCSFLRGR